MLLNWKLVIVMYVFVWRNICHSQNPTGPEQNEVIFTHQTEGLTYTFYSDSSFTTEPLSNFDTSYVHYGYSNPHMLGQYSISNDSIHLSSNSSQKYLVEESGFILEILDSAVSDFTFKAQVIYYHPSGDNVLQEILPDNIEFMNYKNSAPGTNFKKDAPQLRFKISMISQKVFSVKINDNTSHIIFNANVFFFDESYQGQSVFPLSDIK